MPCRELFKSVGKAKYIKEPLLKVIVEIDPEIPKYYRALIPRAYTPRPQMYSAHTQQ